jgi:hypothetical protein
MQYLTSNKVKDYRNEHRPDYCPISGVTMTNPALDHNHDTGMVRGAIDGETNAFVGRIENAYKRLSLDVRQKPLPEMLRAVANFLDQSDTDVLHPVGARDNIKRFRNSPKDKQLELLEGLREVGMIDRETDILAPKNSEERTDLFSKAIKANKWQPSK